MYNHSQIEIDSKSNSRLEIVFLLDSGAFICVTNKPRCMIITQMLKVCNQNQHDASKTLTIAYQPDVPIGHCVSVLCFSSFQRKSRYYSIPFAVADLKYNSLGTSFFEKYSHQFDFEGP